MDTIQWESMNKLVAGAIDGSRLPLLAPFSPLSIILPLQQHKPHIALS